MFDKVCLDLMGFIFKIYIMFIVVSYNISLDF